MKDIEIKYLNNSKAFVDYLQTINDVYVNSEDYNPASIVVTWSV